MTISPQSPMLGRTEAFALPGCLIPSEPETRPGDSSGVELTKKGEKYVAAALAEAGGVMFLTLDRRDRVSIATTIERLISLLDAMDGDEDLEEPGDIEPSVGWPNWRGLSQLDARLRHDADLELDTADDEPSLGAPETRFNLGYYYSSTGPLSPSIEPLGSQASWAVGASDEREDDGDDKEPDQDAEYSIGWENEGSQAILSGGGGGEPDLGWTEEIDQVRRLTMKDGWFTQDGEPYLGWCESAGRGICWEQSADACEPNGDELDYNGDELDFDGSEMDFPGHIAGGQGL